MKTELRLSDHKIIPGAKIIEIVYDGVVIGEVTGHDYPGIRVLTSNIMHPRQIEVGEVSILEIFIE